MKKWSLKRVLAVIGLAAIVAMYGISIVLACLAKPGAADFFIASVGATVIIPIVLYGFLALSKYAKGKEDNGMSARELRKYNRRLKDGESPETLAAEIEAKYHIEGTPENEEEQDPS